MDADHTTESRPNREFAWYDDDDDDTARNLCAAPVL